MTNMTMTIDDNILKNARKYAIEKNTTVSSLVRVFLEQLAIKEQSKKERIIKRLNKCFNTSSIVVGKKNWSRAALHER